MNKRATLLAFLSVILGVVSLPAEAVSFKVDPVHSGISFKVRHFVGMVPGLFTDFQGEVQFDPDNAENCSAKAVIQATSIDTRSDRRDNQLRSDDYLKTSQFPAIEFNSTKWTPVGENTYKVDGLLKMVGIEKPITLDVTYLGQMEARGVIHAGWQGTATLDRTDWGINSGTPTVGQEVMIELNVAADRRIATEK